MRGTLALQGGEEVRPQLWSQAEFLNTYIYLISKIKMFNK
jgi:hypothetical protein